MAMDKLKVRLEGPQLDELLDDVEDLINSPEQAREVLTFLRLVKKRDDNLGVIGSSIRINMILESLEHAGNSAVDDL